MIPFLHAEITTIMNFLSDKKSCSKIFHQPIVTVVLQAEIVLQTILKITIQPKKTSNNKSQRRTFSSTTLYSIVVSRIAHFDELHGLNFTNTSSSSNFEKG